MFKTTFSQLILVRHGVTEWNNLNRYMGRAPIPLSSEGIREAEKTGVALTNYSPPVQMIFSSDLVRCKQTAAIIGKYLNQPVHYDQRLREIDVGDWQGLSEEEIVRYDPDYYAFRKKNHYNHPMPNGESPNMVSSRLELFLNEVLNNSDGNKGSLLLVTHNMPIRMIFHLLGFADDYKVGNASISSIALTNAPELLQTSVQHLG